MGWALVGATSAEEAGAEVFRLNYFDNTEGKEMTILPTVLDDVDEEAPLSVPSTSFNERSLEEPLVIYETHVRRSRA
jgi:hypothetical protein